MILENSQKEKFVLTPTLRNATNLFIQNGYFILHRVKTSMGGELGQITLLAFFPQ